MKPALTASEWDEVSRAQNGEYNMAPMIYGHVAALKGTTIPQLQRLDAVAALCLHNQPYGFTHEDVRTLRAAGEESEAFYDGYDANTARLRSLASRIAALLPPEKP